QPHTLMSGWGGSRNVFESGTKEQIFADGFDNARTVEDDVEVVSAQAAWAWPGTSCGLASPRAVNPHRGPAGARRRELEEAFRPLSPTRSALVQAILRDRRRYVFRPMFSSLDRRLALCDYSPLIRDPEWMMDHGIWFGWTKSSLCSSNRHQRWRTKTSREPNGRKREEGSDRGHPP